MNWYGLGRNLIVAGIVGVICIFVGVFVFGIIGPITYPLLAVWGGFIVLGFNILACRNKEEK